MEVGRELFAVRQRNNGGCDVSGYDYSSADMWFCSACDCIQKERAGMMMSDGIDKTLADIVASSERCAEHNNEPTKGQQ
jgi:hypothetical protein